MKYLLDTVIFLWSLDPFEKLNRAAQNILVENKDELYLSAATSWEISIKVGVGKLQLPEPPQQYVPNRMSTHGFRGLQVTHRHALAVSELPLHHKDPFDRVLIAQSLTEEMPIISADAVFDRYGAARIW